MGTYYLFSEEATSIDTFGGRSYYLHRAPRQHAEYREQVIKRQIRLMHERGIWVEPER